MKTLLQTISCIQFLKNLLTFQRHTAPTKELEFEVGLHDSQDTEKAKSTKSNNDQLDKQRYMSKILRTTSQVLASTSKGTDVPLTE